MADQHYTFPITVATGTTPAAPQIAACKLPPCEVELVTVRVLPGHNGNLGWTLTYGGAQKFPEQAGTWEVVDAGLYDYTPPPDWTSGAWGVTAYNTGSYPHTLTVSFRVYVVTQDVDAGGAWSPSLIV